MLIKVKFYSDSLLVINETNYFSSQYKSAEHFYDIKQMADECNRIVFRVSSIAGQGKREVDHIGGVAKQRTKVKVEQKMFSLVHLIRFHSYKKNLISIILHVTP